MINWVILIFDVIIALVAALLGVLGLKTFRAIRHLGTGKSFWIPVFLSGALFLIGSIVTIFHEVNFSLTTKTDEVVQISRLFALCALLGGIYSYSRRVRKTFAEKLATPEKVVEENLETEIPVVREHPPLQKRIIHQNQQIETAPECKHQFGYLRTLPRNASIPDECLSCGRIIECKHFLVKKIEKAQLPLLKHDQSSDQPTPQNNRARNLQINERDEKGVAPA